MTDQLTAIDDALETGAADHGDPLTRELQELALALRADAPEPDPEFRHELGRRVRSGFPKPATLRQPLWRRALSWQTLYVALLESARTTAMLFMILIGALMFADFINITTMPADMNRAALKVQ